MLAIGAHGADYSSERTPSRAAGRQAAGRNDGALRMALTSFHTGRTSGALLFVHRLTAKGLSNGLPEDCARNPALSRRLHESPGQDCRTDAHHGGIRVEVQRQRRQPRHGLAGAGLQRRGVGQRVRRSSATATATKPRCCRTAATPATGASPTTSGAPSRSPNPAAFAALTLRYVRDDGCVIYLNGVEVVALEHADRARSATRRCATVGHRRRRRELVARGAASIQSLLVAGTNVIAVEVHQQSPIEHRRQLRSRAAGDRSARRQRRP